MSDDQFVSTTNRIHPFVHFQPARHTKLEKADILEMTVKHLQNVQRSAKHGSKQHGSHHHHHHHQPKPLYQQSHLSADADAPNGVLHKFQAGFSDCTQEVSRYISQMDDVEASVKQRLIGHLSNCAGGLQEHTVPTAVPFNYGTPSPLPAAAFGHSSVAGQSISMGGVQLIPSRLPSGELALVMQNSSNLAYFPAAVTASVATTASAAPHTASDLSSSYLPASGAFSSVQQQSQQTTSNGAKLSQSPPLSPSSSISTCGDESSTDFQSYSASSTPPPSMKHNFTAHTDVSLPNPFPTPTHCDPAGQPAPVSAAVVHPLAIATAVGTTTVQQPQISSTTAELARAKPLSVITNSNQRNINNNIGQPGSGGNTTPLARKRPYAMIAADGETNRSGGLLQVATNADCSQMVAKMMCKEGEHHNGLMNEQDGDMWRPW